MFTRDDFRRQVAEMKALEEKMAAYYAGIAGLIDDEDIRSRFESLVAAERGHAARLEGLLEIVEQGNANGA